MNFLTKMEADIAWMTMTMTMATHTTHASHATHAAHASHAATTEKHLL
jgi:hypothetical protein